MSVARHSGRKSGTGAAGDPMIAACLPTWVARSLANGGIRRLSQLRGWKDSELLQLRGVGPRSVEIIRTGLAKAGRTKSGASGSKNKHEIRHS